MEDLGRHNLVGGSIAFLRVVALLKKFSECDATVLVLGETGTGKEIAARAIHYQSPRGGRPFIPVNCGALPDSLIENELFGHVRGAFTDARESQNGLVAHAEGGTLFLDEIECLSAKGQMVLLRFLQDRVYRPLGAKIHVSGDIRVVAASNRDIEELVKKGSFRQDLLYRLAILQVEMPTLRERPGDARVLAQHFMRQFARRYNRPDKKLDPRCLDQLDCHAWPGNVRELENLVHRAFLLAEGPLVYVSLEPSNSSTLLPPLAPESCLPDAQSFRHAKASAVAAFERGYVIRALVESGGNVSAAARLIGKERRSFGRLLQKYGIDRTSFD